MATLPKRVLIAVTSAHAPLYEGGKETGLFITEALHPFNVFRAAGFQVDLASETGKWSPDWLSTTPEYLSPDEKKEYEGPSEFHRALKEIKKASDCRPQDYGIFFASAGHASLIDYPDATDLQHLASSIYADGGIVAAVCHGGAIFVGVVNQPDLTGGDAMGSGGQGQPIIAGKKVTGFTTKGEEEEGVLGTIQSWNRPTIEKMAADLGATYVSPPGPWDSFTVTDGRIVTGANPASATKTAEDAAKAFDKLKAKKD